MKIDRMMNLETKVGIKSIARYLREWVTSLNRNSRAFFYKLISTRNIRKVRRIYRITKLMTRQIDINSLKGQVYK